MTIFVVGMRMDHRFSRMVLELLVERASGVLGNEALLLETGEVGRFWSIPVGQVRSDRCPRRVKGRSNVC